MDKMAAILVDDIFKLIFLNENPESNITEICSQESNWPQASIDSGNVLAPNRRRVITWTNDDFVNELIYAASGEDVLIDVLSAEALRHR